MTPLIGLGIEGVSEHVVRIVLEAHPGGGIPLGVLLREALLGVGPDLELLALAQLDDEDVVVLPVVVSVLLSAPRGDGHHLRAGG